MARRKSVLTPDYHDVLPRMRTGDLVLYAGKGVFSASIKRLTRCKWAHVGLVIRDRPADLPQLWEATTLADMPDLETGQAFPGVRLVMLEEALTAYSGEVAVRLLDVKRTKKMLADLEAFRQEMLGRPYEKNEAQMIRATRKGPLRNRVEDLSSVFCSELIAAAYQRMGLLDRSKLSNNFTPADFTTEVDLPLGLRAQLGPEIIVAQ
jgi:hypothetical protein